MNKDELFKSLLLAGLPNKLLQAINQCMTTLPAEKAWKTISQEILSTQQSFDVHYAIFIMLFPKWPNQLETGPAWMPDDKDKFSSHLYKIMSSLNISDINSFHAWTVEHYRLFWQIMIERLNIIFDKPYDDICDLSNGVESPNWLKGATLNITNTCFQAPSDKTALIYLDENKSIQRISYGELNALSNQVANSLIQIGCQIGDAIAIDMPMHALSVAIYLGIIKMGGIVVSIADSFSSDEIATRLKIANTTLIFTQDYLVRNNKILPLYEKIKSANAPRAIVLGLEKNIKTPLREYDIDWNIFLVSHSEFKAVSVSAMTTCHILFSSGTTGIPKAIPWNHSTAIKAATDGHLHHNIQTHDIIAWPTSLGWMMGPWLIFAGLINQATIALYTDTPQTRAFGEFVQKAKVTILGVVPSLVAHWRQQQCMESLDWSAIKLFSSTGESSNPVDMLYLMYLARYKPIIEYCGGTEIGGAYISSTVCETNYPSLFTTPTMGLNLCLLNEKGESATIGEVAIIPPSMGLSTTLLNADHHAIYYSNMPMLLNTIILRRHGDQLQRLANGCYVALGRVDDTMNLGGIKISSTEIERVLSGIPNIIETAAIGINQINHGPTQLVIFAASKEYESLSKSIILKQMQERINHHLNPLFKIHDIIFVRELPKTASNKIMRRILRERKNDK